MFSWPEVVIIGTVALLFVGPKKLPEMAKSIGEGIKELRKATHEGVQSLQEPPKTCPACHQAITDSASRFCPKCGQSVAAAPSSPAA